VQEVVVNPCAVQDTQGVDGSHSVPKLEETGRESATRTAEIVAYLAIQSSSKVVDMVVGDRDVVGVARISKGPAPTHRNASVGKEADFVVLNCDVGSLLDQNRSA
jgi:hypothetical protein